MKTVGLIRRIRYHLLIQVRMMASKMVYIKMIDLMIAALIMSGRIKRKWGQQDGKTRMVLFGI